MAWGEMVFDRWRILDWDRELFGRDFDVRCLGNSGRQSMSRV
jgi:hypothetical protein